MEVLCPFEISAIAGRTRRRPRVARYSRDWSVLVEDIGDGRCRVEVQRWDDEAAARADVALEFLA